jgi:hypothetical protein
MLAPARLLFSFRLVFRAACVYRVKRAILNRHEQMHEQSIYEDAKMSTKSVYELPLTGFSEHLC